MTEFSTTGNFRDVMVLARRAVAALEKIGSALDRMPSIEYETTYEPTVIGGRTMTNSVTEVKRPIRRDTPCD